MGYDKGFAALRTDYSSGAIIVHWKGAVQDDIRAYAASKPKGVSVVLTEGARHSRAEIHASVRSLSNSDLVGRFGIVGIDVADDSSGMVVQVSGSSRLTPGDMTELTAVLGQSAIEVEYGVAAATTQATRWSDGNPWKGGGAMSVNGAGCSTGFAVLGGVQARGILLGPDLTYPELGSCPGVLSSRCSRYINYVPISTILNTWGVSLEVG